MPECSYLSPWCREEVKYWIKKENSTNRPNWWYPICEKHLNHIILFSDIRISQLQYEKKRLRNKYIKWEDLEYKSNIHNFEESTGSIKITQALDKHRENNLKKYIKRLNKTFDSKMVIVDCSKYNCDMYKFNGQATCFLGKCPYTDDKIKKVEEKDE